MALKLILGGARSGKSALAVRIAKGWSGPVVFAATAEARDLEMQERIASHRIKRPAGWLTVEEPLGLDKVLSEAADEALVLVDCLTLWVSNLMEQNASDREIEELADRAAELAAARGAPTIAVSNEVGWGIVPVNEMARRYRDLLGRVNSLWAARADECLLLVAGKVLKLTDHE